MVTIMAIISQINHHLLIIKYYQINLAIIITIIILNLILLRVHLQVLHQDLHLNHQKMELVNSIHHLKLVVILILQMYFIIVITFLILFLILIHHQDFLLNFLQVLFLILHLNHLLDLLRVLLNQVISLEFLNWLQKVLFIGLVRHLQIILLCL